jgi:membrane-associated phospholipid phosphatase
VVILIVGLLILVLCATVVENDLTSWESQLFRWVNELSASIYPAIYPFMQYGTFITIPLVALIAFVCGYRRLALVFVVSGVGIYLVAKLVKVVVERERPRFLLGSVVEHGAGQESLGFPSGHAAVAGALAVALIGYLSWRWVLASFGLAAVVCFGRVYVGAHFPLDVVAGLAMGAAMAAVVHLVMGVPIDRSVHAEPLWRRRREYRLPEVPSPST